MSAARSPDGGHCERRLVDQAVAAVGPQLGVASASSAQPVFSGERGGHGGGRGLAAEEVDEDAVLLLHVLVDEDGDAAVRRAAAAAPGAARVCL